MSSLCHSPVKSVGKLRSRSLLKSQVVTVVLVNTSAESPSLKVAQRSVSNTARTRNLVRGSSPLGRSGRPWDVGIKAGCRISFLVTSTELLWNISHNRQLDRIEVAWFVLSDLLRLLNLSTLTLRLCIPWCLYTSLVGCHGVQTGWLSEDLVIKSASSERVTHVCV